MKFKSLLLAAAVTAASFSSVANAAIDGQVGTASIDSDIVLFVYDTVKDLSYVQNLNVNYKNIIATNGSFFGTFALDATDLSIFATSATSNLVWGMAAAGSDFTDADGSLTGAVLTATNPTPVEFSQVDGMNQKFNALAVAANTTVIGTANAADASGGASSVLSTGVKGFYNQVGGQVGFSNSASVTASQSLWFVHLDAGYAATDASLASANAWTLNLSNLNTATLVSAPVSAVPLPAAAWLMFSALMGLGGIARRRNAKV